MLVNWQGVMNCPPVVVLMVWLEVVMLELVERCVELGLVGVVVVYDERWMMIWFENEEW